VLQAENGTDVPRHHRRRRLERCAASSCTRVGSLLASSAIHGANTRVLTQLGLGHPDVDRPGPVIRPPVIDDGWRSSGTPDVAGMAVFGFPTTREPQPDFAVPQYGQM